MEEEGEEPFVALDSLLEVNLVEDSTGGAPSLTKGSSCAETDSFKDCCQESRSNILAEDAVNSMGSYAKNTGLNNCLPGSNLDPVQIAWGMDFEEDTFYKDLFKDVSAVQYLRLHCTVCDTHLGCKPGSVLMRHVRLGTLLCKDCFTFYGAGEFPVAEDGSESFCYWCGQGGNVICCSSCSAVFCKKCIKLNYSKSMIKEIETSPEWMCFVCNYRSLWEHRAVCRAAITYESSDHGSLEGDEENQTPGHSQEFCCGPTVERRIPRLKSSMPSVVTFGEYIKAGRVKSSVMKMLRNISSDSNEDLKTEKIIPAEIQTTYTESADPKETLNSEQCVTTNHSNKESAHAPVASQNISYVGVGPLISQARFSGINSQPTTGVPFFNQGMRPNIISNSQDIPSGRVVVMPPVHIAHRTSVIRLPQHNSSADALSLGALLSSSPPVGSVPQPPNPVYRFHGRTTPLVVVRNSSGAYVPMYVNNNANFHYIPKESNHISGVQNYVQYQGTSTVINHPSEQQEKSEDNIKYPHSSIINNAAPFRPNINGHTSQNMPEATFPHTGKSFANSTVKPKSKTKSGYIQVRSPTALQSVTVSDIVHSPLATSESLTSVGTEQKSIYKSLSPSFPSGTVPSAPASLAKDQSTQKIFLKEIKLRNCPQNKPASKLTSSNSNVKAVSVLKNILSDVSPNSSTSVSGTHSSKEIPEAHVVNRTCPELPSKSVNAIETNWFKENLLEAENVAKYMLTRITCVQEELDGKSHQKQEYDNMINNFNKLLEISGKKLSDVIRKFTANLQRWKAPSCHADLSQETCANTDKQSSVETMNEDNNSPSHEEVEIISVKVSGKRKRSNSESQISPPVTCAEKPGLGSAIAQEATSSDVCTVSAETASQVAKPINTTNQPTRMFTRRSKATKSTVKCCSGCEPDQQFHSKQVETKQNMGSSRVRSGKLLEQEKYDHIPEKRKKLKDLRIVLERIPNPGEMVIKRELNDKHNTSDSNAKSLDAVTVVKDQSYVGRDDLVKLLKPCSVVIHRLNERDITHCI